MYLHHFQATTLILNILEFSALNELLKLMLAVDDQRSITYVLDFLHKRVHLTEYSGSRSVLLVSSASTIAAILAALVTSAIISKPKQPTGLRMEKLPNILNRKKIQDEEGTNVYEMRIVVMSKYKENTAHNIA